LTGCLISLGVTDGLFLIGLLVLVLLMLFLVIVGMVGAEVAAACCLCMLDLVLIVQLTSILLKPSRLRRLHIIPLSNLRINWRLAVLDILSERNCRRHRRPSRFSPLKIIAWLQAIGRVTIRLPPDILLLDLGHLNLIGFFLLSLPTLVMGCVAGLRMLQLVLIF